MRRGWRRRRRRTPVRLQFAYGPWRNRFVCSHKQDRTCWLRPCVGRWFGLVRLQRGPIAYRYLRQLIFPEFWVINIFTKWACDRIGSKTHAHVCKRRTIKLYSWATPGQPAHAAAASSAELGTQTTSSQQLGRRPRKLRFGLETSFYLHIGWSLGLLATDTFLLRWSSSKYSTLSVLNYWCDFPFKKIPVSWFPALFPGCGVKGFRPWACSPRRGCWSTTREPVNVIFH